MGVDLWCKIGLRSEQTCEIFLSPFKCRKGSSESVWSVFWFGASAHELRARIPKPSCDWGPCLQLFSSSVPFRFSSLPILNPLRHTGGFARIRFRLLMIVNILPNGLKRAVKSLMVGLIISWHPQKGSYHWQIAYIDQKQTKSASLISFKIDRICPQTPPWFTILQLTFLHILPYIPRYIQKNKKTKRKAFSYLFQVDKS